jgi:hypothetical protein
LGLVRTLLLKARRAADRETQGRMKRRILPTVRARSALAACPLVQHVLSSWAEWCAGAPDPNGSEDSFWGV